MGAGVMVGCCVVAGVPPGAGVEFVFCVGVGVGVGVAARLPTVIFLKVLLLTAKLYS